MITASGIERVMACPASEALDHVHEESAYAARGQAIHSFLEALKGQLDAGRELAPARMAALETITAEHRPVCEAIDVARLPPLERFSAEYALAWNYLTDESRALGNLGARRAYVEAGLEGEGWLAGTADLIAIGTRTGTGGESKVAVIGDWKSGWSVRTEARSNPQLMFLAMMAIEVFGCSSAEVFLVLTEESPPRVDHATIGPYDMAVFQGQVHEALQAVDRAKRARAAGERQTYRSGPHCTYCPGFKSCPAKHALIAAVPTMANLTLRDTPPEEVEKVLAERFEWYQQARAAMERLHVVFREWATARPIQLSDGRVYGPVLKEADEIDGAAALPQVRDFVANELAAGVARQGLPEAPPHMRPEAFAAEIEGAFSFETTKTALERVARGVAGVVGRPIAAVERDLHTLMRARGAIVSRPKTEVKVSRPKPPAKTAAK